MSWPSTRYYERQLSQLAPDSTGKKVLQYNGTRMGGHRGLTEFLVSAAERQWACSTSRGRCTRS